MKDHKMRHMRTRNNRIYFRLEFNIPRDLFDSFIEASATLMEHGLVILGKTAETIAKRSKEEEKKEEGKEIENEH